MTGAVFGGMTGAGTGAGTGARTGGLIGAAFGGMTGAGTGQPTTSKHVDNELPKIPLPPNKLHGLAEIHWYPYFKSLQPL